MAGWSFSNISNDTTVFPWAARTPAAGLRAIAAVVIALVSGQLAGHASAGAIAAGAAFTVGFAIFHEAIASSLLSMGIVTAGIALGTLVGSLSAQHTPSVLLIVAAAGVGYGLLSGLSAVAGWIGMQIATYVIVASYFPNGLHYAIGRTEMVLAGGGLQMLLFALYHLFGDRKPGVPAVKAPLVPRLQLRLRQLWQELRGGEDFHGDAAVYTVRLTLTLLLCTAIYRRFHVRNGYWSPMTALLVAKPQWSHTLSRGIARLTGTLVGAAVAVVLARYFPLDEFTILAMAVVTAWACYALQAVNYAMFSLFVTLNIVFLFRSGGFSQTSAAHIRLMNTALGGGVALAVDATWKLLAPKASGPLCADGRMTTGALRVPHTVTSELPE
jgi:hypothetical protein